MPEITSVRILGVRVDPLDRAQTVAEVGRLLELPGKTRMVATVNPEFVMHARRDPTFAAALERAELAVADGAGVVWALRRRGQPQRERVTGVDLVPELLAHCAAQGRSVFFLGAAEGVAEEVSRRFQSYLPNLRVVGAEPGSPRPEDDQEMVAMINQKRPDLLLVAYGHPKQELWIYRNRHQLEVRVAMGVGGAFDVLAGRIRRAPQLMQRYQLEWFWRLLREPWRIRRMAVLPYFAVAVLRGDR